jgi:polar amino acid transport system substrate-binding protein
VHKRVHADVTRERRTLADAHARHVEELAAGVAHEIRNPITAAKSLVQQMGEDPTARDNVEYAGVALAELERVEKSISHLLRFAREEDVAVAELSLADVVAAALDTLSDRIAGLGVKVECDVTEAGTLRGDAEKLRRVVINLLGNALDAFAEARTPAPRLELSAGKNLAGTEVWLRVCDNGPGMDAEKLGRIWSPFYTSKSTGTGLGLALSKKVVEAHGGTIEASSAPGAGSEFIVTLPRRTAPPAEAR